MSLPTLCLFLLDKLPTLSYTNSPQKPTGKYHPNTTFGRCDYHRFAVILCSHNVKHNEFRRSPDEGCQ
jgi:hypothetical protein